jgi:hypothetical protein
VDGPFTFETAHRFTFGRSRPVTADHLDRLVESGLLRAEQREGRTRYHLWETVRVHARRRTVGPVREPAMGQARSSASPGLSRTPFQNRFARQCAIWMLGYAGRTALVPDAKGLQDLSLLPARPSHETHCSVLMGAAVAEGDLGVLLDVEARGAYRRRVGELRAELTEAEDANDLARAEHLRVELDALVEHLSAAAGLTGRGRRHGGTEVRPNAHALPSPGASAPPSAVSALSTRNSAGICG